MFLALFHSKLDKSFCFNPHNSNTFAFHSSIYLCKSSFPLDWKPPERSHSICRASPSVYLLKECMNSAETALRNEVTRNAAIALIKTATRALSGWPSLAHASCFLQSSMLAQPKYSTLCVAKLWNLALKSGERKQRGQGVICNDCPEILFHHVYAPSDTSGNFFPGASFFLPLHLCIC